MTSQPLNNSIPPLLSERGDVPLVPKLRQLLPKSSRQPRMTRRAQPRHSGPSLRSGQVHLGNQASKTDQSRIQDLRNPGSRLKSTAVMTGLGAPSKNACEPDPSPFGRHQNVNGERRRVGTELYSAHRPSSPIGGGMALIGIAGRWATKIPDRASLPHPS